MFCCFQHLVSIPATYTADMNLPRVDEGNHLVDLQIFGISRLPSRSFQWNKSDQNDQIASSNHNLHDFWGGVKKKSYEFDHISYPLFNLNPPFQTSKSFFTSQGSRQNPKIVTSKRFPKGKKIRSDITFFLGGEL